MVELFVPSREPVTGNTEPKVRGSQAGRVGTTWGLGLGPGPWGIPLWPHICWTGRGWGDDNIYFGQGIWKKKSRGEETVVLKLGVGPGAKTNHLGTFPWEAEGKQQDQEMQSGGAGRHGEVETLL